MGANIATNQLINKYYDLYRDNEVTFSKDMLKSLRIDPRQIYVKCAGDQWPCIINSTSFQMAKIIIGTAGGAFQKITKKDAPPVSIRYCFIDDDGNPLYFFVTSRVTNVTPYMNSQDLAVVTLTFTQRPPDDLIMRLGTLLDANASFINRKDERILINDNTKRALGIYKKESIVYIQNVPRRCILWDISFSGTKIIIMGLPNFLKGKECVIRFMFEEPGEIIDVKGTIMQADPVEGRRDLVTAGIKFDENLVPLSYKVRINEYFSSNKKMLLSASGKFQDDQANDPTQIVIQAKKAQEEQAKEDAKNGVIQANVSKDGQIVAPQAGAGSTANTASVANAQTAKNPANAEKVLSTASAGAANAANNAGLASQGIPAGSLK